MMNKRLIVVFLILMFGFFFSSCNQNDDSVILFNSNGGTMINGYFFDSSNATFVPEPINPSKPPCAFAGWYKDNDTFQDLFDFDTEIPISSLILHAKWQCPPPYAWGSNEFGQIGDATNIDRIAPVGIYTHFNLNPGETVLMVKAGSYHTLAVSSLDNVFTWGQNDHGQLGDSTTQNKNEPTDITGTFGFVPQETITYISTGAAHNHLVTSEHRVFAWGNNKYGQLGDGTIINRTSPVEITNQFALNGNEYIKQIVSMGYHSLALTSEQRVFAWGNNTYGQIGNGTHVDVLTPIDITNSFNLPQDEVVTSISTGNHSSYALTSAYRVFAWGRNDLYQLGNSSTILANTPEDITPHFDLLGADKVMTLVSGGNHVLAITMTNRLYAWGHNASGQLGTGNTISLQVPTFISYHLGLSPGERVSQMFAGPNHSAVLTTQYRTLLWGEGSLAINTQINMLLPVDITTHIPATGSQAIGALALGLQHAVALPLNIYVLAFDTQGGSVMSNINVMPGTTIGPYPDPVRTGYDFMGWFEDQACTIPYDFPNTMPNQNLTLYACWELETFTITFDSMGGDAVNAITELYLTPIDIFPDPIKDGYVFDGWYLEPDCINQFFFPTTMPDHDLVLYAKWLMEDPTNLVFSWGYSELGQLADGNPIDQFTPVEITPFFALESHDLIIMIAAGYNHGLAVSKFGRVFVWGDNDNLQLGLDNIQSTLLPVDITARFTLLTGERIIGVAAGGYHSLAWTNQNRVFAWGLNDSGQLGIGHFNSTAVPTTVLDIDYNINLIKIVAGLFHTMVLTETGHLFVFGNNDHGQLGNDSLLPSENPSALDFDDLDPSDHITDIAAGERTSYALTGQGQLFSWGAGDVGQIGYDYVDRYYPFDATSSFTLSPGTKLHRIYAGSNHAFAVTEQGNQVFAWGLNNQDQLGNNTGVSSDMPIDITAFFNLLTDETIVMMTGGSFHSLALTSKQRVFSWGSNYYGQLGHASHVHHPEPLEITDQFNTDDEERIAFIVSRDNHNFAMTRRCPTISFNSNGGTPVDAISGWIGSPVQEPDEPTLAGYEFAGWYQSPSFQTLYVFTMMPGQSITLYAKWEPLPDDEWYNWGSNQAGELGDGSFTTINSTPMPFNAIPLQAGEYIEQIITGQGTTFVITSNHVIYAMGSNESGQLGNGNFIDQNIPVDITANFGFQTGETVVMLVTRWSNTLVYTSHYRLFIMGNNDHGQFGNGTLVGSNLPVDITSDLGLAPGETLMDIAAGMDYVIVLTSNHRVLAWGSNQYGQLGNDTTTDAHQPVDISIYFTYYNHVVIGVHAGIHTSYALTEDNDILGWGYNVFGEIGDSTYHNRLTPVLNQIRFHLAPGDVIVDFVVGDYFALVLISDHRLVAWGRNDLGQLCRGVMFNSVTTPMETLVSQNLNPGEHVIKIGAGGQHAYALTSQNRLFTFGGNTYGQLGDSTTNSSEFPVDISTYFNLMPGDEIADVMIGEFHMYARIHRP